MLEALEKHNKQDVAVEENSLGLTAYEYHNMRRAKREGERERERERVPCLTFDVFFSSTHVLGC